MLDPFLQKLESNFRTLEKEHYHLRREISKENQEICQAIGIILEYPWFKDDQKNFPGSTEEHGVCVGDHVAISMVYELINAYKSLKTQCELLSEENENLRNSISYTLLHFL